MPAVDVIHQGVPPTWSLQGFFKSNEADSNKIWRSVIGKEASVHFIVDRSGVYQIWYQYFPVVKPLKVTVFLDGVRIDQYDNIVIATNYGYTIKKMISGAHVLKFEFDRVRAAVAGGDQRPIPVAFTELRISPRLAPVGLWGSNSLSLFVAGLLSLSLIVICFILLIGSLRYTNNHPK